MCFGLKNINFEYFHTIASFIKNLLHLRVILIPMARQMSKYTTGNNSWSLWGCFGYLCSLKNLQVKLTLSRLITSFQTLPEIGLNAVEMHLECLLQCWSNYKTMLMILILIYSYLISFLVFFNFMEWFKGTLTPN